MGKKLLEHLKQLTRLQLVTEIGLSLIALGCVIYLGYYVYHQFRMDQMAQIEVPVETEAVLPETEAAVQETEEPEEKDTTIDFDALHEQNEDIYAWINIPGTDINYPVLQSETENYYLNRNLDDSTGLPGCIYTNNCNEKDFSSYNTVMYGHNMKNGTMFAGLHKFEDEEFFDENQEIIIYTEEGEKLVYQIYAATAYSDIYITAQYDSSSSKEMLAYIKTIESGENAGDMIHIREDIEITSDDKVLTLSTCISGQSTKRYLLIGVLDTNK